MADKNPNHIISRRSIEVLWYLSEDSPRPKHIDVPSPVLLRRMHDAGWITSPAWTMKKRPDITEKGKIVLALAKSEAGKILDGGVK